MDARQAVMDAVRSLGVECWPAPPPSAPPEFATVVAGGGRVSARVACTTLASVTAWAPSAALADELCRSLRDALCLGVPGCLAVSVNSDVRDDPDPESGRPRATVTLSIDHRL